MVNWGVQFRPLHLRKVVLRLMSSQLAVILLAQTTNSTLVRAVQSVVAMTLHFRREFPSFVLGMTLLGCASQALGTDTSKSIQPGAADSPTHVREMRGAWIATVFNIDFPSDKGLSVQAMKDETIAALDAAAGAGLNTIFFQVRGEADAMYASELEPWSRVLTGTQGIAPAEGFDPLRFIIDEAHIRGLELHAWLNPYRASVDAAGATASSHVVNTLQDSIVSYDKLRWLDPASPEARAHTLAVIRDIVTRYDVDGIHFDDYFYPYPKDDPDQPGAKLKFDDDARYNAYAMATPEGAMSLADWRRNNVHLLVEGVHNLLAELSRSGADAERIAAIQFGISPFGIYKSGVPEGTSGTSQYDALFSDPLHWMRNGWVDYIAPQLYWTVHSTGQPYDTLMKWWGQQAEATGRNMFVGNAAHQLTGWRNWEPNELAAQVALTQQYGGARGNIFFSMKHLMPTHAGANSTKHPRFYELIASAFATPAATPPHADAPERDVPKPMVTADNGTLVITTSDSLRRSFAIYERRDDGWRVRHVVAATDEVRVDVSMGSWAVRGIDRRGRESDPVEVSVAVGAAMPFDDTLAPLDFEWPAPPMPDPPPPIDEMPTDEMPTEAAAEPLPTGACEHSTGNVFRANACTNSSQCCNGQWVPLASGGCNQMTTNYTMCECHDRWGGPNCAPQ